MGRLLKEDLKSWRLTSLGNIYLFIIGIRLNAIPFCCNGSSANILHSDTSLDTGNHLTSKEQEAPFYFPVFHILTAFTILTPDRQSTLCGGENIIYIRSAINRAREYDSQFPRYKIVFRLLNVFPCPDL